MEDTILHESTPLTTSDPRKPLHWMELQSIVLKYEGKSYSEISEHLGLSVDTVKSFFRRGSPVYGAYWRYAKEVSHQVGKEALKGLQKQIKSAVDVVNDLINDKSVHPSVRLRASMYVIDKVTPIIKAEQEKRDNFLAFIGELSEKFEIYDPKELEKYLDTFEQFEDYM